MIPLVDTHCHLLAGLDDGPSTEEEVLAMCRIAFEEGTRHIAAVAHQNEQWDRVTPERIRQVSLQLGRMLQEVELPLKVYPCAEVMVSHETESLWESGDLLSVADRGQYLLIELPHGLFLDLRGLVDRLVGLGVRPILAHPERQSELLHGEGTIEELIRLGCLVQVSSDSITRPRSRKDQRRLRRWFRNGIVHLIGSDGHSAERRPPRVADAYRQIAQWAGQSTADRVCSTNGLAVLSGLPLKIQPPRRERRRWLSFLGQ